VPVTDAETPVTDAVNYYSTPSTFPLSRDVTDDLCAKAAREVEASRLLIKAQDDVIKALRAQAEDFKSVIQVHKDINAENQNSVNLLKAVTEKDQEIFKTYENIIALKDKEIVELKKAKKKGILSKIGDVLIGVGIAAAIGL
jgi:predicted phage tail protein